MSPVSPNLTSSLWDFSQRYYARPQVADACLRLQDEQGVNVNLLLWCLWLGQGGLRLDAARLRSAQKRIHAWDEHYVVPLRQLRRRMKVEFGVADLGIEQVREQIKKAELSAEKQLQLWLEAVASTWTNDDPASGNGSGARDNLRFYLHQLGVAETLIAELIVLLNEG